MIFELCLYQKLKDSIAELEKNQKDSRSQLQTKKGEWETEKRRRAEETMR